jgi:hypothetical protein
MAEFGVQATQLSAPQGAGAQVIAPAEEKVVNTSMIGTIASVGDLITSGIKDAIKANAKASEGAIISSYSQEIGAINAALASGTMRASEAAARSQAVFSKYATAYPQYQDGLSKSAQAFKGFSEIGSAVDAVKTEQDIRKSAILAAQGAGYVFYDGMSREAEDATIRAYQTSVRVRQEFSDFTQSQSEKRAQGTYDQGVASQESKALSVRLLNDIAGGQMDSVREFGVSLGQSVRSGSKTPDEAKALIASRFSQINLALQSAAGINPELAGPYRSIFTDLQRLSEQLADPKVQLEQLTTQIDALVNKQKLLAVQDPTAARAVATSQLFGQNAQVLLSNSPVVASTITKMLSTDPMTPVVTNPVVGNPEVEKPTYDFLKKSMSDAAAGRFPDSAAAADEINNSVRHVLKQTSQLLGSGADAKTLQEAAAFFASPEYGKWASENNLSLEEQQAAYKTFQLVYEPTVIKGIEQRINQAFMVGTGLTAARAATGAKVEADMRPQNKDNFVITFNGSGVTFNMKSTPTDPLEARAAQQTMQTLKGAEAAMNQLIRIGAHMEGKTDYSAFWEANKHILAPTFFSKYQGLEIGQVVEGYRYIGGDAKDSNSWEVVK